MVRRPKGAKRSIQSLKNQLNKGYDVVKWEYDFYASFSKAHGLPEMISKPRLIKLKTQMSIIRKLSNLLD